MSIRSCNIAVIGGGVLGCAIARRLGQAGMEDVLVLEKEHDVARHASGRNSGVVHSGFHLKPGSLKAQLCVAGSRRIADYCRERDIPFQQVGKLIVAVNDNEAQRLPELQRRAEANGLRGSRLVSGDDLRGIESAAQGVAGFFSPHDGIIDARRFVKSLAHDARDHGVRFAFDHELIAASERDTCVDLRTSNGSCQARWVINCSGLHADRIAHLFDVGRQYAIIPFRGEYFALPPEQRHLVHGLVYPTADPRFPFLGVHFTRTVHGDVLIGPNAVLAWHREAYGNRDIRLARSLATLANANFIRMATRPGFIRMACRELTTSWSKQAFVREARKLIPAIEGSGIRKHQAGIRAQLVDRQGRLVMDFTTCSTTRSVHVLNAVSPGFSSSLAFADHIVDQCLQTGYFH